MSPHDLITWVVYQSPTDYPGKAVARKHINGIPTTEVLIEDSMQELMRHRSEDMWVLPRDPEDDPVIVEVWV